MPAAHALTTTDRPVAELRLFHRNPRKGDVAKIKHSLTVNGQYKPIVVNAGTHTGRPDEVLAGNHTLMAARDLGWETIATVTVDVDDDQAIRIVAADNRTSDLGTYDDRLLLELLAELPDLDGTGYDPGDLDELEKALADDDDDPPPALTDPDDVPVLPTETVTKPGDLWMLGPHRLAVGDATDTTVWDLVLNGDTADMVWTDPPYGVSIVGGNHSLTPDERRKLGGQEIQNDALDAAGLADFLGSVFGLTRNHTRAGAAWYVTAPPGPLTIAFGQALIDVDVLRQTLVWVKDSLVMGHSDYHYRHEPIYYGWTPGAAHHPVPDRKQDTVFEVDRPKRSKEHPTMKPVELITGHIENSTDPVDLVVDPFAGSGSTLIACHGTNRRAALIELDPRYADVICRRYQEHTGTTPTRDGVPHDFTRPDDA